MIQKIILIKKYVTNILISTRLTGFLLLIFATSVAVGTFIENDFGRRTAKAIIYNSTWFEAIILFFAINLTLNFLKFKLYRKEKIAQGMFHFSFIIIILGACITRYISFEGVMHIREGEKSNEIITENTYIKINILNKENNKTFEDEILLSEWGRNSYSNTIDVLDDPLKITLDNYIPAATKQLNENKENGKPTLHLVMSLGRGRENIYIQKGEKLNMGTFILAFNDEQDTINPKYLTIIPDNKILKMYTPLPMSSMSMDTREKIEIEPGIVNFKSRTLYTMGDNNIVLKEYQQNGEVSWTSIPKEQRDKDLSYMDALKLNFTWKNERKYTFVVGQSGVEGQPKILHFDDFIIKVSYGSKKIEVPLTISLRDFVLERYPGSDSPSSFESHITIIDEEGLFEDRKIFMNNVMDYGGYRFFQSSYDRDEKGTILSVNHDLWGTRITYLGYFLLALGMILSLFSRTGSLRLLNKKVKHMRKQRITMLSSIILIISLFNIPTINAQVNNENSKYNIPVINKEHAENFGKVLIQDMKGRIKPINTMASEIIHKITKKNEFNNLDANQLFLGMLLFPSKFVHIPIIRVNSKEIAKQLNIKGKYASFVDFYNKETSNYLLSEELEKAYHTKPGFRSKLDKEYILVDERVNICYLVLNASILRIFPDSAKNNKWMTPHDIDFKTGGPHTGTWVEASNPFSEFMITYSQATGEAMINGTWDNSNKLVQFLIDKQREISPNITPSESEINAEIFYNNLNIFNKLTKYYLLIGIFITLLFFVSIFFPKVKTINTIMKISSYGLMLTFAFHTFGLGLRWYISGHAPWSDGYESLIYIAWASVLAGIIFSKKSIITTGFMGIFGGLALWVASISLFEPEITPLVPVLKSYWLTIHVSMITASYGFFGLGAVTAIGNLIVMILKSKKNKQRVDYIISELSCVSEMTLTIGIIILTIGTFLGGIWANESWGRYWGWDPKEAWAFISILVYAFVLHVKYIPGLRGNFVFNVLSIFSFYSILMTYFGVNFFLSGLHSYAAGDPIPIPNWVYVSTIILLVLAIVAYIKEKINKKKNDIQSCCIIDNK